MDNVVEVGGYTDVCLRPQYITSNQHGGYMYVIMSELTFYKPFPTC